MKNEYWSEILGITKTIIRKLENKNEAIVNDIVYKKDGSRGRVSLDFSKTKKQIGAVHFVFGDAIPSMNMFNFRDLERVFIDTGLSKCNWIIDSKAIWLKHRGLNKEGLGCNIDIAWDSGYPNSTLYGQATTLKIKFSEEGNYLILSYPWLVNPQLINKIEKLVESLTTHLDGYQISLIKKIDFDTKMEEVIVLSGIRDIMKN